MLDYEPEAGIPPDGPRLGPAIERIIAAVGATPDAVTADRCYGLASVDAHLEDLDGARIWCGWGTLSHNLIKVKALTH